MSIEEITERVYHLGNAWEQFKQVNDDRLNEIEKKGHADPLYMEHLSTLNQQLEQNKRRVDHLETVWRRPELGVSGEYGQKSAYDSDYRKAFTSYLRKGMESGLGEMQSKALSVGSDPDGGYLVTEAMSDTVARTIYESSPIRQLASVETISTDALDVIEDTGESAASWTTETGAISDTTTPQIGKHSISVHEMYAQPKATQKLVDDASINIEQWIAQKVAEKFARLEATGFISGSGSGQPKGILSYTAGTSWGQIEQINSGSDGAVTSDSLIKLYYALKEEHARSATFLMNRSVLQSVRLLKEATTNQYLWQPGLAAGAPDTLLGIPVMQAADMPVAATNSLSVAVGDFRRAYLVVDRVGLRILRDPFTEKPFIKFYTTRRVGGEVVNYQAIKLLKLAV